jgi:hypothetical protein
METSRRRTVIVILLGLADENLAVADLGAP